MTGSEQFEVGSVARAVNTDTDCPAPEPDLNREATFAYCRSRLGCATVWDYSDIAGSAETLDPLAIAVMVPRNR